MFGVDKSAAVNSCAKSTNTHRLSYYYSGFVCSCKKKCGHKYSLCAILNKFHFYPQRIFPPVNSAIIVRAFFHIAIYFCPNGEKNEALFRSAASDASNSLAISHWKRVIHHWAHCFECDAFVMAMFVCLVFVMSNRTEPYTKPRSIGIMGITPLSIHPVYTMKMTRTINPSFQYYERAKRAFNSYVWMVSWCIHSTRFAVFFPLVVFIQWFNVRLSNHECLNVSLIEATGKHWNFPKK